MIVETRCSYQRLSSRLEGFSSHKPQPVCQMSVSSQYTSGAFWECLGSKRFSALDWLWHLDRPRNCSQGNNNWTRKPKFLFAYDEKLLCAVILSTNSDHTLTSWLAYLAGHWDRLASTSHGFGGLPSLSSPHIIATCAKREGTQLYAPLFILTLMRLKLDCLFLTQTGLCLLPCKLWPCH